MDDFISVFASYYLYMLNKYDSEGKINHELLVLELFLEVI